MSEKFLELTDENLIEMCRQNDQEAYSILVGRYLFVVRTRAAAYNTGEIDFEDLVQEGLIGLMNAVKSFDKDFGTKFSTFATLCIDRNILSAVRKALSKKQIPKSALVFIEEQADFEDFSKSNPEDIFFLQESVSLIRQRMSEKLSKREKSIMELYLAGKSYVEIADALCCSQKAVDNALTRARKKLR